MKISLDPYERLSPRTRRLRLLQDSDWTQLPDSPLSPEQKIAWAQYRQALRDIDFQEPIIWPQKPGA